MRALCERISLDAVVDANLEATLHNPAGHSATTVHGGSGHRMRQTVLALAAGRSLAEHEVHGDATLLVLDGSVRVFCADESALLESGDLLALPRERHSVEAVEPSAVLLTVALD